MSNSYSEKINITQKSPEKKIHYNFDKLKRNLGFAGLVALGIFVSSNMLADPTEHPEKAGKYNENIKTVELSADANLRENPYVDNDEGNLVTKLDHDVTVQVTGGSYEKTDEINGDWIYVDREDLAAAGVEIKKEGAWVNEQKADVEYADSEK